VIGDNYIIIFILIIILYCLLNTVNTSQIPLNQQLHIPEQLKVNGLFIYLTVYFEYDCDNVVYYCVSTLQSTWNKLELVFYWQSRQLLEIGTLWYNNLKIWVTGVIFKLSMNVFFFDESKKLIYDIIKWFVVIYIKRDWRLYSIVYKKINKQGRYM
jgi:hypothetical protein